MVAASNELTVDWIEHVASDKNFVLSGAGVWSLLAALAAGASGDALGELKAAVGLEADEAAVGLNWLLDLLRGEQGMSAAFGIWVSDEAPLREDYRAKFPHLTVDFLPDEVAALDEWVKTETNNVLDRFPGEITPETLMLAATALVAEGEWTAPFIGSQGKFGGSEEWIGWLARSTPDLSTAAILEDGDTKVGRAVCETDVGFDVHLLTGSESLTPAHVLALGAAVLTRNGDITVREGASLKPGHGAGGLKVATTEYGSRSVSLSLPAFEVDADWDLLEWHERFGLTTALDSSRGHFDLLSHAPLAAEKAVQVAKAGFSELGFRAAAVTACMAMGGSAAMPQDPEIVVSITLDRPFGFLVVHRDSGLVLFAGWVQDPRSEIADSASPEMGIPIYPKR